MAYRALIGAVLACVALSAGTARAQVQQLDFGLSLAGFSAGSLTLAVNREGDRYAARGQIRAGGLVGLIVNFKYDASNAGRIVNDYDYRPVQFEARNDNGKRAFTTQVRFENGVARDISFDPPREPRPWSLDPAAEAGKIDPLSGAMALLLDRPVGRACDRTIEVFDGGRSNRIRIGPREASGDGYICRGVYSRVGGYSPRSMRRNVNFDLVMFYREVGGIMQVTQFQLQTTAGTATAVRR
ncbi:MAG: DUF3108 domain-containing protein [Pseudomonadota bacterium]